MCVKYVLTRQLSFLSVKEAYNRDRRVNCSKLEVCVTVTTHYKLLLYC